MSIFGLYYFVLHRLIFYSDSGTFIPNPWLEYAGDVIGSTTYMLYLLMSAFLFVESIRQLLFLPAAVFELPDFSVYVPHFG